MVVAMDWPEWGFPPKKWRSQRLQMIRIKEVAQPAPIEDILQDRDIHTIRMQEIQTIIEEGIKEEELAQEEERKIMSDAADLLAQLKKGKKLHDEFSVEFNEHYQISGKTILEWRDHFRLQIPPDLTTRTCQDFDVKLLELHQEASFLKAACECRLAAYRETTNKQFRTAYASLVAQYTAKGGKLPAKDTLTVLAKDQIGDIEEGIVHAEIELSFWKDIIADLYNSRKIIENATLNLGIESKALLQQHYIDGLQEKKKY